MKDSTITAITAAFVVYRESLADDLGKQSAKMFISGDLAAQALTGVKIADNLVQAEALQYAKEYGGLLRKEGASIINGKKIYWLKDSTDKMRVDTLNTITKGIEEGKSMPEVTRDLRKTFVREHDYQLRRIARTETARIQNHGATNRYDKLKITHVHVHDNEGPNSCEDCEIANGSVWEIAYARSHELEHPNCVRSFSPIIPDDWELPE